MVRNFITNNEYLMHPEIKKFWEDSGFEVKPFLLQGEEAGLDHLMSNKLWYAHKGTESKLVADISENKQYYKFGDKHFLSEEEMLKLIKLKAFL